MKDQKAVKVKKHDDGPFIQARAFLEKLRSDPDVSYPVVISEEVPSRTRAKLTSSFQVDSPEEIGDILSGISSHALVRRIIPNHHIIYIDILSGSSREDKPDDAEHTRELYDRHMPGVIAKAARPIF